MNLSHSTTTRLNAYRKHNQLPLDGIVAGLERPNHYRQFTPGVRSPSYVPQSPWHEYAGRPARSYEPLPGFMDLPEQEYEEYEPRAAFHRSTPPLRIGTGVMSMPVPEAPDYNDCLMTDALSEIAWRRARQSSHDSKPASLDTELTADDHVGSPVESLEQIIGQEAGFDQMQQIEAAIDQQINEAMTPPEPEIPDPYEMQRMHEQQFMDPFGMMGPGPMM
jgi:hypothetical protein